MTTEAPLPADLAVLVSGGLDSAILLAEARPRVRALYPLYVRFGLYWEAAELAHLRRFLEEVPAPSLRPLVVLDMPVGDLYGQHWALTGQGTPTAGTPDEDVYLPGRNVLFLAKAILWCHLHQVPAVALAPLEANPFPDATADFFDGYEAIVNQAIGGRVKVLRPYRHLSKAAILHRGRGLPLVSTFSCIRPIEGRHCGACNKCHERREGFRQAGVPDPTSYGSDHVPRHP